MIEIKCLECINCTGDSCKVYGSDADKAVKSCVDDFFKNYQITIAGAINHLEDLRVFGHEPTEADKEALGMAIEALEKQIPKQPERTTIVTNTLQNRKYSCPTCGMLTLDEMPEYCCNCGQKIDWGDIE